MQKVSYDDILAFIAAEIIPPFYQRRLENLNALSLRDVLKRKNPYLFKVKNITTAQSFVVEILQAHLSSQEETLFGGLLERLAIFICQKAYGGFKSSADGIDLEFVKDSVRYIVAIKSGPNWANKSQKAKMLQDFKTAKRTLGTNTSRTNVVAVNGCCYGKDGNPDKGEYLKLCGQEFWSFISGDEDMYIRIIAPLDEEAKRMDDEFKKAYDRKVNLLTSQFLNEYCTDGEIDWAKLLKFVSGKSEAEKVPASPTPESTRKPKGAEGSD